MVLSRVRLIRVRLVLVNLNPINDTYMGLRNPNKQTKQKKRGEGEKQEKLGTITQRENFGGTKIYLFVSNI